MLTVALASGGLLVLTWVVYPVLMQGVAMLRGRGDRVTPYVPDPWPTVTVVIASRENAELIRARVQDVLAGDYPGEALQVVVALDRQAPASAESIGLPDPRVAVVRGDEPGGKAAALNAGVRAAAGDILVFTDTHQRFAPGAIRELVGALAVPSVGAVSGQLELPELGHRSPIEQYWRLERRLRRAEARLHSAIGVTGAIYAMRRSNWAPLPAGLILDDLYVPMRLILDGFRVGYCEAARAFDSRRTLAGQEFRRKVRTLTGNYQLCAWLPGCLLPWHNPVWPQFLLHKLMRLLTPWLVLACLVGTAASLMTSRSPVLAPLAIGAAGMFLLALVLIGGVSRAMAGARWAATMLGAILLASYYGLTGRWNVWSGR